MTTIRKLHDQSMLFAQRAIVIEGYNSKASHEFYQQAFNLEKQAAELVPDLDSSEPTRSILYHSAASLAFCCGYYDEATKLIDKALQGKPSQRILDKISELQGIIKDAIKAKSLISKILLKELYGRD